MRKFSDNFRESLRGINEINTIISYKTDKTFYILTTENNDNILTQSEDYLVTQQGNYEIIEDNILSVNPLFNTDLFKSVCKTLEIETKEDIPIGTKIKVKIGVKVNENFEYMDFGYYYVKETSHSADNDSYYIIAYDKMYESMISYDDNNANIVFPITIKNLLINICNYLGWNYYFDNFINYDKVINIDLFKEQGLTYRDILDNISQVIVGNLIFDENDILKVKYINDETNNDIIVEEQDLRNINVDIKEKYGPVNSLIITTNDNVVLNNLNDESSINQNGRTKLQINDNYILINNSDDFIENMFNKIKGLQYYIYDINTIGLLIFEPLDRFKIKIGENIYSTILLNDDLKITTGIEEDCFVEKPDTNVNEYKSTNADKNKLNNAVISLDKANANIKLNTEAINKNSQDIAEANASIELNSKAIDTANAEIVLKANADGKIVKVKLGANASTGSTFTIDADQVNLTANDILNLIAGNTINLTAKNIKIDSENFKVDEIGNATLNNSVINMTENNKKVAEFNKSGMDFYRNDNLISHMGTTTVTDNQTGVGELTYDETSTNVKYNSVISWNSQRSSGSNVYDSVIGYYNLPGLKGLVIRSDDVIFNGSTIEIKNILKGSLIFQNISNAGVITTSLSQNDNLWISRIVGDGTGNLIASSFLGNITISGRASDKRLKKNIKLSKDNALNKINKIKIYEFDFKQNNKHVKNGVIAQELEKIDDTLVIKNNDEKGLYQINDLNLLSLAIKGIQEQQEQIKSLQKQINELKEMINNGKYKNK